MAFSYNVIFTHLKNRVFIYMLFFWMLVWVLQRLQRSLHVLAKSLNKRASILFLSFFPRQNQIDSGGIRTRDHKTRIRGSGKFFKIFSKIILFQTGGLSTWKKYFWHEKKYFWSFLKKMDSRGFESHLSRFDFALEISKLNIRKFSQ